MSRYKVRTTGLHADRQRATARAAFVETLGDDAATVREAVIAALPVVDWKGKTLRTLRCTGTTGKGPHNVNVPESLLWALLDVGTYRCAFHPAGIEESRFVPKEQE
jgi:hypothetical protein